MELMEILHKLIAQKDVLDQAIAVLEELQQDSTGQSSVGSKRRGRKFMSAEEREQVSERMKRYWASRRKPEQQGSP